MNNDLIAALLDAGLIQFGRFEREGAAEPYWLRLEFLPSYPAVLKLAAAAVAQCIDVTRVNRLVCAPDAISLAALVSQALNIPLVIHTGDAGGSQRTLVGAYDVGHPTVYISLTSGVPPAVLQRLTGDAASVGLHFIQWVALLELAPQPELVAAVSLHDITAQLVERGELSAAMAARVMG